MAQGLSSHGKGVGSHSEWNREHCRHGLAQLTGFSRCHLSHCPLPSLVSTTLGSGCFDSLKSPCFLTSCFNLFPQDHHRDLSFLFFIYFGGWGPNPGPTCMLLEWSTAESHPQPERFFLSTEPQSQNFPISITSPTLPSQRTSTHELCPLCSRETKQAPSLGQSFYLLTGISSLFPSEDQGHCF